MVLLDIVSDKRTPTAVQGVRAPGQVHTSLSPGPNMDLWRTGKAERVRPPKTRLIFNFYKFHCGLYFDGETSVILLSRTYLPTQEWGTVAQSVCAEIGVRTRSNLVDANVPLFTLRKSLQHPPVQQAYHAYALASFLNMVWRHVLWSLSKKKTLSLSSIFGASAVYDSPGCSLPYLALSVCAHDQT